MQTTLYICRDDAKVTETIAEWRSRYGIADANFHEVLPDPTIGIDAVRAVQHLLGRKPYGGGNRLIVLREADKATVEAQNALLKLLEEPPESTYIVVFAGTEEKILATVRSRSHIIRIAPKEGIGNDHGEIIARLVQIVRSRPGERVLISQDLSKTREDTLAFLNQLIPALSAQLHHPAPELSLPLKHIAIILKHAEHARRYVEGNVHFKATLDILLLGFPKMA